MNREFEIRHIFREANKAADQLAHWAQELPSSVHILHALPANIVHVLAFDKIEIWD